MMTSSAAATALMTLVLCLTYGVRGQTAGPLHGVDSGACIPKDTPNSPGNELPDLPESFSLRVECNLLKKARTTTLHEYYNYDANIAAVRQIEAGTEEYFFYLYDSNQFLTVTPDTQGGYFCYGQDLSKNENREIFGLKKNSTGGDRIFSVMGALHFGNGITEDAVGSELVRGIPCRKWHSCQYWDVMDATANVDWYFSDNSQWSSISGYTAPVRCHVTGIRWVNTTYSYNFEHIYEFYDFQADLDSEDSHFEVPRNTFCNFETNTKALPTMPPAYSFDQEVLDVNAKTIGFNREEYDNMTKLLRYDHREAPSADSVFGTKYISQIHDFNTGVAYILDILKSECTVQLIGQHEFDDANTDPNHVRLRNPNEFLDLNHDYLYQGVRSIRGIDCDSWATQRFDYPVATQSNPQTTWTWYFATVEWMKSMGFRDNFVLPVMLEIFGDATSATVQPVHKQISFYEYNAEEPDLLKYDLSSCYGVSQSKNYAFLVPGRFRDIVGSDVKTFKYQVLLSLEAVLSVSPLRIAHMDVQEAGENVLVSFDLLDKAPLPGDVTNPVHEPSLTDAFNVLTSAVTQGRFQIILTGGLTMTKVTVKPAGPEYQIQQPAPAPQPQAASRTRRSAPPMVGQPQPAPSKSGYTGGAMGGMAIGMLLLGALVGFGVMFAIYKIKGGTFSGNFAMERFDKKDGATTADEDA